MSASDSHSTRGILVVLEGLDRSGKSTQVNKLVENLNQAGKAARLQKFPDRTTAIGHMIDAYLQSQSEMDDHAIHLLFSANRWEVVAQIERDLERGISVIADRYAFSGIAFSAAKGLPFDFCLNPDSGLPLPDITLYLTVPPEIAAGRAEYGSERYESLDVQRRVRDQFDLVGKEITQRHGDGKWEVVEAGGGIEEIAQQIWKLVNGVQVSKDVGRLWS